MRLSNTLMINASLLPSNKKAFTLAEVLITLSILGVVAALTIPSLVNRQSDLAAQTKLKKAIASYETAINVYMAETGKANAAAMMGTNCANADKYFKVVDRTNCIFTTADGAAWNFDSATGNATVVDAKVSPRYGVTLWNNNGRVNDDGTFNGAVNYPTTTTGEGAEAVTTYTPYLTLYTGAQLVNTRHVSTAALFMNGTYACAADPALSTVEGQTNKVTCTKAS